MKPSRTLLHFALAMVACTSSLHAQSLLIRGGTLIDGTGRSAIQDAQILIRDGTIAEIRAGDVLASSGDVEVLDAPGKFIIPGLIDSHIHYRDSNAELFLAHGVTTVNDLGNPYQWQAALKKGFNSGRMFGPRFFFCGEIGLPENGPQRPTIERR